VSGLGRYLVAIGLVLALAGAALMLWGRASLPGDIVFRRGNFTLYVPIVTSIVLSIVLTVLINVLFRGR
jgi:hypothetical protein